MKKTFALGFLFLFTFSVMASARQNKRYAELTVVITKHTFTEKDGGQFVPSEVCKDQEKIEVLQGDEQPEEGFYRIGCYTQVGSEDVLVLVGGLMKISDRKQVQLGLWVDPDSAANKLLAASLTVATDLENKRLDAILEPYVDMDCQPIDDENMQCTPTSIREYFSVRAEIKD